MKLTQSLGALVLSAALLLTPALAMHIEVYDPAELPMLEPERSDWAVDELDAARKAGLIVDGLGGDYTLDVTRSQFARLAVNLAETAIGKSLETAGEDAFPDCGYEWVRKASAAGIVNGLGDGTFGPDALITREQIAAMLCRTADYIGQATGKALLSAPAGLAAYTDAASVASWASESVDILAASDIMKGTSDTTLTPQGSTSIEQAVLLCWRLYQRL